MRLDSIPTVKINSNSVSGIITRGRFYDNVTLSTYRVKNDHGDIAGVILLTVDHYRHA